MIEMVNNKPIPQRIIPKQPMIPVTNINPKISSHFLEPKLKLKLKISVLSKSGWKAKNKTKSVEYTLKPIDIITLKSVAVVGGKNFSKAKLTNDIKKEKAAMVKTRPRYFPLK